MEYARRMTLRMPHAEAIPRVQEAFAEQGLGTLMEIDLASTVKQERNEEIEPYSILAVGDAGLVRRALAIDPSIALLLPWAVVIRGAGGESTVEALDPETLIRATGREELRPLVEEVSRAIDAALESLGTVEMHPGIS